MAIIRRITLLLVLVACAQADTSFSDFVQNWQNEVCSNQWVAQYVDFCQTTTTTSTMTNTFETTISSTDSTTVSSTATTSEFTIGITPTTDPVVQTDVTTSSTPLERAHWCQFQNGSTIALGYSFMYSVCAVCQCLPSRLIRCTNLQCMTTYCIDGSQPVQRPGQCCSQCAYEADASTCTYGSVTVPHGTLLKQGSSGEQCWCQMGTIECRRMAGSFNSASDLWGDGTGVYIIVIILVVLFLLGTLSCVGCSVYFYYYYQKRNQTINEEYAQYYNHAGWQPMDADGVVEEKKVEGEQVPEATVAAEGYYPEYVPPPYAVYNGQYPNNNQ